MQGLTRADFGGEPFLRITPQMVRQLGSANDALVLVLVTFRCLLPVGVLTHLGPDDEVWWASSAKKVALATGLSSEAARRSLRKLVEAGYLASAEHQLRGWTDRTKSYRPLWDDTDLTGGDIDGWHTAEETAVPIPKNNTENEIKNVRRGFAEPTPRQVRYLDDLSDILVALGHDPREEYLFASVLTRTEADRKIKLLRRELEQELFYGDAALEREDWPLTPEATTFLRERGILP